MYPRDCPSWEYDDIPNARARFIAPAAAAILIDLRRGTLDSEAMSRDTRPVHVRLFQSLAPAQCPYYAGHYRGESYRCLKYYDIRVQTDPRVGAPAPEVPPSMDRLSKKIHESGCLLDSSHDSRQGGHTPAEKLYALVVVLARLFEEFCRVHPYVNGNGHAGRFLVISLLGRYGYYPKRWAIEPRPPDPPYSNYISSYRSGQPNDLEQFILRCIVG
ncbi:MAG: Fic family protein [Planctomycetales bacterium]|nr:Fic family protein [Planctomycetales bacterium]